ncbi:MAG: enoyl-CoA hydratase [Amycolatopsis sp.]|nr:enoyl-CoA hydratase [Amycolatopsis sp.]
MSRFAQGASAAFVAPQALAILADLFPEGPARTRALGIFQGATAAGASAGIVLGGVFTEFTGWRVVFLINPPIILALVIAIRRVLPARPRHAGARLDIAGAGVVNRVVPDGSLFEEATELARKIARGPTLAHVAHKALLRTWATGGLTAADSSMLDIALPLFESDDFKAGMVATITALRAGRPRPPIEFHGS